MAMAQKFMIDHPVVFKNKINDEGLFEVYSDNFPSTIYGSGLTIRKALDGAIESSIAFSDKYIHNIGDSGVGDEDLFTHVLTMVYMNIESNKKYQRLLANSICKDCDYHATHNLHNPVWSQTNETEKFSILHEFCPKCGSDILYIPYVDFTSGVKNITTPSNNGEENDEEDSVIII